MVSLKQVGLVAVLAVVAAAFTLAGAQEQLAVTSEPVSYQDVIKLLRSGNTEEEILNTLAKSTVDINFVLGESQIQELKKMRVSAEFIEAISNLKNQSKVPSNDVTDFALILDCSGSMMEKTKDGTTKMEAAKKTVTELIQKVPNGMRLTFVIYGHDKQQECQAVRVVRSLSELDDAGKTELTKFIATLQPSGHTPIARALQAVGKELANRQSLAHVVLITDGVETCKGDPAREAAELAVKLKLHSGVNVIGFGLRPHERNAVETIAQAGRGKFYDVQTAAELQRDLSTVTRIVKASKPAPAEDDGKISPVVQALIDQLIDDDADVRHAAAESLGKMGAKAKGAVVPLMNRLADERWGSVDNAVNTDNARGNTSKDAALKALKKIAPEKAEEALVTAMKSKNSMTKEWATVQLASIDGGSKPQGPSVTKTESPSNGDLPPAVKALVEQLSDEDANVRHAAAESLGKMGAKAKGAVPALVSRLTDDLWGSPASAVHSDNARGNTSKDAALKALKKLAPEEVDEALATALKSRNSKVKIWAASALAADAQKK